jgi:soluble lytic murein transglycosylase-like protein
MTIQEKVTLAARRYGVPADLAVRLARQESGLRQYRSDGRLVVSSAGAIGVMQLMPATAAELGVDPYDEDQNIEGGIRYLRQMFDRFGDWKTAVAAYNAGPGRISKVLKQQSSLPAETANYVVAVMGEPFFPASGASSPPASGTGSPPDFLAGRVPQTAARPGQPIPKPLKTASAARAFMRRPPSA